MALKHTINELHGLLFEITQDLQKAEAGNKAAAQRVRTGSIRLEKTAKKYRKESVGEEKKTVVAKKAVKKPVAAAKAAVKPAAKVAKKVVAKAAAQKVAVRSRG